MSRKAAPTNTQDLCLTQDRGYFVENEGFEAHLEAHKDERQPVRTSYFRGHFCLQN